MLKLTLLNAGSETVVELAPGTAEDWQAANWEQSLQGLAVAGRRVIFHIREIDPDGLVFVVTNFWLQLSPRIVVHAREDIRDLVRIMHGEQVEFAE